MKRLFAFLLLIRSLAFPVMTIASVTINAFPGPDGNTKVQTPWGDFIVVEMEGTVWVGTEAEYFHARDKAASEANGFREMVMSGGVRVFVQGRLPSTSIGKTDIAGINTEIMFDVGPNKAIGRNQKPASHEYVGIVWTQSDTSSVRVGVLDKDSNAYFVSKVCGRWREIGHCEFVIPRVALTHEAVILFMRPGLKPAAVPIQSVAKATYQSIRIKNAPIGNAHFTPDKDDQKTLETIHALDESIPSVLDW